MARITLLLETRCVNSRGLDPVLFRLTHNSSNTSYFKYYNALRELEMSGSFSFSPTAW